MRLNIDEINWEKLSKTLFVVVAIIVIIIIWFPNINPKIAKYTKLDEEMVDELASTKYTDEYIEYVSQRNTDKLFAKISPSYISYNGWDKLSFREKISSEIDIKNMYATNVKKIEYRNSNIYRVSLNRNGKIRNLNIIENDVNDWYYTYDDFYNFKTAMYTDTYEDVKFVIDSIYQTFDYIEFTCYIENNTANTVDINLEQKDSVLIVLNDNQKVKLSNTQIDRNLSVINQNSFSSRTFKFNIELSNQQYIEYILFTNIEINGEKGSIDIYLNI